MALIVVDGDKTQGHCWPPAPLAADTQAGLPGKVKINEKLIVLVGDGGFHPGKCGDISPHPVNAMAGSPSVFVNNIPVVRDGDPMDCGDVADTQGSMSVFANGGGNINIAFPEGAPPGSDPDETLGYVVEDADDLRLSYPTIILPGRVGRAVSQGGGQHETFKYWRPSALSAKSSNPFEIVLTEETVAGSSRKFISTQGVGASLPPGAPEVFQQPLDPFVTFEVVSGPFTVTNSAELTLVPTFIPGPLGPKVNNISRLPRSTNVVIKMIYGGGALLEKEFIFNIRFSLTEDP